MFQDEIEIRQKLLNVIAKADRQLRVVALGLFPRTKLDGDLFQTAAMTNDVLAATAMRFARSFLGTGAAINSLRPALSQPNGSGGNPEPSLAVVSDTDIAACASLLLTNDARAIIGRDIELGHGQL
jgi:hypothetical protein